MIISGAVACFRANLDKRLIDCERPWTKLTISGKRKHGCHKNCNKSCTISGTYNTFQIKSIASDVN